jgi:hypothetical protein
MMAERVEVAHAIIRFLARRYGRPQRAHRAEDASPG